MSINKNKLVTLAMLAALPVSFNSALAGDPPPAKDINVEISMTNPPQLGSAYHSIAQNFSAACVEDAGGTIASDEQSSLPSGIESGTEEATSDLGVEADGRILLAGGDSVGQLYNLVVAQTPTTEDNYAAMVGAQSTIEIFDPASMGVYSTAGLTEPRSQMAFAAIDANTFLVIGGMGSADDAPLTSELLVYNAQ